MYQEVTIQLTEKCNISCPYCFAPIKSERMLSTEDFDMFAEFCKLSSPDVIHVTGGEPSLNPNFGNYVSRLASLASLVIYSNFTTANMIDDIRTSVPSEVVFLLNTNGSDFCSERERENVNFNLNNALSKGYRVALSHTFYSSAISLEDTFSLLLNQMAKYEIGQLRISQAIAFNDATIGLNREKIKELYHYVAGNIKDWRLKGFKVYFDCPVPPCYVDARDFKVLRENRAVSVKCLPKVFVMWNLDVTHCYSTMDEPELKKLTSFNSLLSAREYSTKLLLKKQRQSSRTGCHVCYYGSDGIPCGCPSYCV